MNETRRTPEQSPLLDRLLAVGDLLQRDMERAFAGTALTPSRVHLLWILRRTGPLTQRGLSGELGITPRSVSALVDALEPLGYLYRAPHPEDRRAFLVTLTPLADGMMARMEEDHAGLEASLRDAVAPADREAFDRGLGGVLSRLAELFAAGSPVYDDVESGRGR